MSPQHRSRANQPSSFSNLDEILENITKIQQPSQMKQNQIMPSTSSQKSTDMAYLIIGIIAGILLILLLILIAVCMLRLLQQKKIIGKFI